MSHSALLRLEALRQQILCLESRMHENVPVRFGRGRLDSLATKGLAAYLIATRLSVRWCRGRSGAVCSELFAMQEADTRRSSTWVPDSRPMCKG